MRIMFGIFGLSVLIITTGCQSSYQTLSDKTIRLRAPKRGLLVSYHILRTNTLSSDQMISVQVRGYVKRPGVFEISRGSTLLEAIAEAGGFTIYSNFRKPIVTQGGNRFKLRLQQKNDWRSWKSFAWYGETSDFLLQDGAVVQIGFATMFQSDSPELGTR